MTAPSISTTVPASGATGVPVNTSISITFDREVDTYRLQNGGIIVEGPDESKAVGPGFIGLNPPPTDNDEFLDSPSYYGLVDCTYTFSRVDGSGDEYAYYDYGSGDDAGLMYRTKVTITPKEPFGELTQYTVYVIGDEDQTDSYEFGCSARSVYDTAKGANIGNGEATFYGGYTGSVRKQFFIEITGAGDVGTATYEWWTSRDGTHRTGKTSAGYRLLEDGVKVKFTAGRSYRIGDEFSAWCDVPVFMTSSYSFSFTTSTHTVEELPTPSTLITGIEGTTTTSTSTFSVLETSPSDRATHVPTTTTSITVTFSEDLDSSTISSSTVSVEGVAVDESIDLISATGDLTTTLSVSGATLTITLAADQLYENNLVVVSLDEDIASDEGDTLGEAYEFFFATTLNPFYAGTRHVRLRLGSYGNSFPDETVNLAIWDASREVDALTPPVIEDGAAYERAKNMFVVCLASWYLLGGLKASSGGARKRLADLDISKDLRGTLELSNDLEKCIDRYELALRSGGDAGFGTSLKPAVAIKGEDDNDEPAFGRRWGYNENSPPIANARYSNSDYRRWYRGFYRRTR